MNATETPAVAQTDNTGSHSVVGRVVSNKMNKTIAVEIERLGEAQRFNAMQQAERVEQRS